MAMKNDRLLRIGVFYDGTYFAHVSNFYLHNHPRASRLSIEGLHRFIRAEASREEQVEERFCQIVDAHYFRGRLSARQIKDSETESDSTLFYRERQFDDVLTREGVTMHFMPMPGSGPGDVAEKGIDVWFALEAFELALLKKFDIVVLVTGDGDFVPLVRKLNTHGTRVMLIGWDLEGGGRSTRTSQALINEVNYPIMMHDEIENRGRKKDLIIDHLFVKNRDPANSNNTIARQQTDPAPPPAAEPLGALLANSASNDEWREGHVCHYADDRGFGFIKESGDENAEQVFFHISALNCLVSNGIAIGQAVRFKSKIALHQGRDRLQASAVELLESVDA